MTRSVGILGVGHIATYMVRGWKRSGADLEIVLSPRGAESSAALAAECGCEVAVDNQAVVDRCDVVILSARPAQVVPMIEELRFRDGQLLVSVAAGLKLEKFPTALSVARALPISSAAINESPTLLFPDEAGARSLFELLGHVLVLESEEQFESAAAVSSFYGWVFGWLGDAIRWGQEQGLSADLSRDLVLQTVLGAVKKCAADPDRAPDSYLASLATPGGFTELGLKVLAEHGGLEGWRKALDAVAAAMHRGSAS